MPKVALVTTSAEVINDEDVDIEILLGSLREHNIDTSSPKWHDPQVDWSSFDLVIMRSPWDYPERLAEFLRWLDRVDTVTQVLNPPAMIRWNLDKKYLFELAERGVRIVPTVQCPDMPSVAQAVGETSTGQVIVKPNISVGSRDTGRFVPDDPKLFELAATILRNEKDVLIQPAVSSVATKGEHALVYFDGSFSHSFRKGPILDIGGTYVGGTYTEDITPATVSSAERKLSDDAISAITDVVSILGLRGQTAVPLYARFDVVELHDGFGLLEAELFEPSYFLNTAPGSAAKFVTAVRQRLTRLDPWGE